jgi:hypothetical protein
MATVPSPPINTSGNPPTAQAEIITQGANGGSTPAGGLGYATGYGPGVVSSTSGSYVLPIPAFDLLFNPPGDGYPF